MKVLRDVSLKRELAIWLDAKLTDIEKRHNLDAKNAALLRGMAIKRLSKFKKSKKVKKNLENSQFDENLKIVQTSRVFLTLFFLL